MSDVSELEWRDACKGCFSPEWHKVLTEVANTPQYLRNYFFLQERRCVEARQNGVCDKCGTVSIMRMTVNGFRVFTCECALEKLNKKLEVVKNE